jgi:hypothetical protein
MGIFDFLRGKKASRAEELPVATPEELALVCFAIAYRELPTFADSRFEEFKKRWDTGFPSFAQVLCGMACTAHKVQASLEQLGHFKTHDGQLTSACKYYLVQFPSPPPAPSSELVAQALKLGRKPPVLAPYFAAILVDQVTGKRACYVLGQALGGGTTLRSVSSSVNSNLGRGPEPTVFAFLESLKNRLG